MGELSRRGGEESDREFLYELIKQAIGPLLLPEYQSQGLGTRLVSELLAQARESCAPVRLQVFRVNRRARRFYDRLGFLEVGGSEPNHLMEYR